MAEINAAWGQAVLLLYTIAKKLNFIFEEYVCIILSFFYSQEKLTGVDLDTFWCHLAHILELKRLTVTRQYTNCRYCEVVNST